MNDDFKPQDFTKIKFRLKTDIDFEQGLMKHTLYNGEKVLSAWICRTREASTRQALIQLGWTPPPENEPR